MSMQLEAVERAGGGALRATLTPQARRLLEGPVVPTLLRLAAPTVVLMPLQGVIAAGEAAFVGRLGYHALAGVSLSFPVVMLMTTLSAGAYGGGVASGVARALGAGNSDDAARLAGTAIGMSAILGLASTLAMMLFGRAFYAMLGATGPALEAAVLYSEILFLGAVPFWLLRRCQCFARRRQHDLPGHCGRGPWRARSGGFPARHLWSGPRPRARRRRGGLVRRRLQRGDGRRALASCPGVRLADKARHPVALIALGLRFDNPPHRGPECRQHADDQPHFHHPDGPGHAVRGRGDRRVRCRGVVWST